MQIDAAPKQWQSTPVTSNMCGADAIAEKVDLTNEDQNLQAEPLLMEGAALAAAFAALLKDHSKLGIRLREVPFDWMSGFHRLRGTFYYVTFADGVPTVQEFIEYLYDCLVPYCLPKKNIKQALEAANPTADYGRIIRLGDEAKGLFIRAKNQLESGGEPGELILYTLLEWSLKAPRLVSKMYLKTNANMPVHGTDGIHLGFDDASGLMTIYFGESKIYKDFSAAAKAAFSSMRELISNSGQISREIAILNNVSDLESLDEAFRRRVIEYINPYSASEATLMKRIVHACLLGFEYPAYKRILALPPDQVASAFELQYRKRIAGIWRVVERHYSKELPVTTNLHLFLLPFPSVDNFRKEFYKKLGVSA